MNWTILIATFINFLTLSTQIQQFKVSGVRAELIPDHFYKAIEKSDSSKQNLQITLQHFLERIHKNLTVTTLFSDSENNVTSVENIILRLQELSTFFYKSSISTKSFSTDSFLFFEMSKNSSRELLLRLRQIPTAQPSLVKIYLTNYFAEMEFFHTILSEIIDEAMEYSLETLRAIEKIFSYYADTQNIILENWKLKLNLDCYKLYVEFLQHYSAKVFKCAAGDNLQVVYDVYSVTKLNVKYIMAQLEFRIQRLFNCFMNRSFTTRCKFVFSAERDFRILFSKLADLEIYLHVKTKKDSFLALRFRRKATMQDNTLKSTINNCIPIGFPHSQMSFDLNKCFYLNKK
ncbi:uncharacterized protein LOC122818539 [Drosophila biarmipes]|uniref:uncharacterized protein LOC122818539 n=1 Tax=Drosophila biarmipes TaxID=125945 RepID=UPI0021CCA772|nr:uncharacterized protein LOC122818539 [Drosophila biarmipes]